jgi:murein DD-endopeptidase MepM/ murein hydrolase activator NlpD
MDDRRLTLIIVPHGDLETRTLEIPYWKLKFALFLGLAGVLVVGFMVAMWFPIAAQAGRVRGLEQQLERLESERAQVAELAETLAEVEEQYERVRQLLGADGAGREGGVPELPPLRRDTASRGDPPGGDASAAGVEPRIDWPLAFAGFVTRAQTTDRSSHPGLDIAAPAGSQVRAVAPGVVREAGFDEVYGEYVVLDHGAGLESVYGHASRVLVRPGDVVARGEVIALTGSTGRSSAPHLHFEIRKDGVAVDPLRYVRQPR